MPLNKAGLARFATRAAAHREGIYSCSAVLSPTTDAGHAEAEALTVSLGTIRRVRGSGETDGFQAGFAGLARWLKAADGTLIPKLEACLWIDEKTTSQPVDKDHGAGGWFRIVEVEDDASSPEWSVRLEQI